MSGLQGRLLRKSRKYARSARVLTGIDRGKIRGKMGGNEVSIGLKYRNQYWNRIKKAEK
jgi:hypothetical protein